MKNKKSKLLIVALFSAIIMIFASMSSASDTGEVFEDDSASSQALSCTMDFPDTLQNGQVFQFQVGYSGGTAPGPRTENFYFIWPTRCADIGFRELTLRQKAFGQGGASASFEDAVTPSALCVEGKGLGIVVVSTPAGLLCSAYKLFQVNNP
jgi:hypothetical protein